MALALSGIPGAAGDAVGGDPALALPPRPEGPFKSITLLVAERRHQEGLQRFRDGVRALSTTSTQTLVLRLATTSDPLMLWAQHLELDRRGIPPCLRWPANESTIQHEFITWLADVLWFTKRNPAHVPRFRGWKGLFTSLPTSAAWHAAATRQFMFVSSRYSVAYWCATGMGLSDGQRRDLMTLPTKAMEAERRKFAAAPFAVIQERLLSHAMQHPDRSGARTPDAVAARRARLLRTFLLSGRSASATAKNWHLLTGEALTRQAVAKQVGAALDVLNRGHSG